MDESTLELAAIAWFETLRIPTYLPSELAAQDWGHTEGSFFLSDVLASSLRRVNPEIPVDAIDTVVRILRNPPHATLLQNNRWFHELLVGGADVECTVAAGDTRLLKVKLVNFDDPALNDIRVVRQLSLQGSYGRRIRPDMTVFVNGIPLAIIELKSPSADKASIPAAIEQLERYSEFVPSLFVPNLLLIVSDGLMTRVGALGSHIARFQPWRSVYSEQPTLEGAIRGIFEPSMFVDFLENCVVFEENERGDLRKKIAAYQQFRAMRNARSSVLSHVRPPLGNGDGRGGVIWHTQGSGKSLTMLMLAGALIRDRSLTNPTIIVVTDRNDLDDQLFSTFAMGRLLIRQAPVQAESRAHLVALLDRPAGGVVFTTIFKFTESDTEVSTRANIVVIADEAHRSQYGFVEGGARWMREALPNATFVGFTGTPLEKIDKNTMQVFGEYADVYDLQQAVEDGATRPLFYESRIVQLTVDARLAGKAEQDLTEISLADASGADIGVKVSLEALLGAASRVRKIAEFIVEHWEKRFAVMPGKAIVVTMSRDIAARLYDAICEIRPTWHNRDDDKGSVKVVISGSLQDSGDLQAHIRSKAARKKLADRFRDAADDFRLAIVCDMWLTGFDCPAAHTIYIDKPLAGHNLMQTIARVNRVFGEKPGGLVVDMIGLADQLADAIATYTQAGGTGEAIREVQASAVPAMQSAAEKLDDFFFGCDLDFAADDATMLTQYLNAADHALGQPDGWIRLRRLVKELSFAFALSVPRVETEAVAPLLSFYQRLVTMMRKRLTDERDPSDSPTDEGVNVHVRQVIGEIVSAGEVIDLFAVAGLGPAQVNILNEEFLLRVAALPQKNLALQTLKKLLTDQISISERTNVVQAKMLRQALEEALVRYTNKAITTAETVARLLELARELRTAKGRGDELGLTDEEAAFYDALAETGSAKELMQSDTLRLMARELVEMIRRMPKLDWSQRESVRAGLRRSVRRLLAKYGYPPDLSDDATQLVVRQAELATENVQEES